MNLQQAVSNSVAYLNENYPGWHNDINISILDMADCRTCVMGQLGKKHFPKSEFPYIMMMNKMSMNKHKYPSGFSLPLEHHNLYGELTEMFKQVILQGRAS